MNNLMVATIDDWLKRDEANGGKWAKSPYRNFRKLALNSRGKVGENFIANVLGIETFGFENIHKDGTYDLVLNGKKIEVKTASVGSSNNTFQYENYYHTADYLLLVSIDVNAIYTTIIPDTDVEHSNVISCHFRHDTKAIKMGSSITKLKKDLGNNTISTDDNNVLKSFIEKKVR